MQIDDIIKYSQQLIAHFPDGKQLGFNGFFVRCREYFYFVTVNHGVAPDLRQADNIYLILHANSMGLNTRALHIKNWQFVDFYEFPCNNGYTLPRLMDTDRLDLAFYGVQKETLENSIEKLPFFLDDADSAICHKKKFDYITLTQNSISPTRDKKYYVAGKIYREITMVRARYDVLYFSDMEYIGDFEGLYEFRIQLFPDNCNGLSGSPVFDEDKNFVGMAVRYRENDNVLRVFPANDIAYYLYNDCTPSPEEIECYKQ